MDPLSALSIAASVAQFIEFGCSIYSKIQQIADSADGMVARNSEVKTLVDRWNGLVRPLQDIQRSTGRPESELAIMQKLSADCLEAGKDLNAELKKLVAEDTQSVPSRFKTALKSMLNESKIKKLETKLAELRKQLMEALVILLTHDSSEIRLSLASLLERHEQSDIRNEAMLSSLQEDIVNGAKENADTSSRSIINHLTRLTDESLSLERQRWIVDSLYFASSRPSIEESHGTTLDWIFFDEHCGENLHLRRWLECCSGIYWIMGKPGCGKSTLMKRLASHPRTKALLNSWAAGKRLAIANFYFWISGNEMDRSQEGLLRAILHELLRQRPDWIPKAVPDRWSQSPTSKPADPWTRNELLNAISIIIDNTSGDTVFCFFIDGLDEYGGEGRDVAKLIQRLASHANIKICVSSREWNAFHSAFGETQEFKMSLQSFTIDDIRVFVKDRLVEEKSFARYDTNGKSFKGLVRKMANQAEGVWIWVSFAIQDICKGLDAGEDMQELRRRLEQSPKTLDGYYQRMLDNMDSLLRTQTSKILLMALGADVSLPIIVFAVMGLTTTSQPAGQFTWSSIPPEDHHFSTNLESTSFGGSQHSDDELRILELKAEAEASMLGLEQAMKETKTRLNARCQDLMRVSETRESGAHPANRYVLEFNHRTAKDFMYNEDVYRQLSKQAGDSFDPHECVCEALLSTLKLIPAGPVFAVQYSYDAFLIDFSDTLILKALQVENEISICQAGLLNEANDVVASKIAQRQLRWPDKRDYGPIEYLVMPAHDPVFWLAVHHGLTLYIEQMLNDNPSLVHNIGDRPMLLVALRSDSETLIGEAFDFEIDVHGSSLAKYLLIRGADPNQTKHGTSTWAKILVDISETRLSSQHFDNPRGHWLMDQNTLGLFKTFLEHGADPHCMFETGAPNRWKYWRRAQMQHDGPAGTPESNSREPSPSQSSPFDPLNWYSPQWTDATSFILGVCETEEERRVIRTAIETGRQRRLPPPDFAEWTGWL